MSLIEKFKILENLAENCQKADKELKDKDPVAYDKKMERVF